MTNTEWMNFKLKSEDKMLFKTFFADKLIFLDVDIIYSFLMLPLLKKKKAQSLIKF